MEKILAEEIQPLASIMYVPHRNGFLIFEKFYLQKSNSEWIVETDALTRTFFSSAVAIAWCIFRQANDLKQCLALESLAREYSRHYNDVKYYNKLISNIRNNDFDKADLFEAKKSESQYRATQARAELLKYLNTAKYWQTIGFNNETTRPIARKQARTSKQSSRVVL